ncbi:LLM class flavin-dependent oxidoreductase [Nocardia brevicatena]|uniref:LLM class flavin-dependent oxidoreductase n=1 Tax=Nocardia brevicatena TaxID=37327 RepID=UPI0012FCFDBB|nr:LLM class flavin-dependent oxidoreductase [Nocardia brevicatena]
MEPLTWLAFLAGGYPGVRVGLGAYALPIREVQRLAKQSATLDNLTEGNHVLVLSPGLWKREFDLRRADYDRRGRIFANLIDGLIDAFVGEPIGGEGLSLPASDRLSPIPFDGRAPELWLAGAAGTCRRALERGLPFQARAEAGRRCQDGPRMAGAGGWVLCGPGRRRSAVGSGTSYIRACGGGPPEHLATELLAYADADVDDRSIIPGNDDETSLATVRALVSEVLPRLRESDVQTSVSRTA